MLWIRLRKKRKTRKKKKPVDKLIEEDKILEFGEAVHLEEKDLINELKTISSWMREVADEMGRGLHDVHNMIEILDIHKGKLNGVGLPVTESQKDGTMGKIKKHIYTAGMRVSDIAATKFYKGKK